MATARHGIHPILEAEADRLIKESFAGVTSREAKSDILTPWKEKDRRRREVYSSAGIPDPATRQGMFHRRTNPARPDLNSRDGLAAHHPDGRAVRFGRGGFGGSLSEFVYGD